jgi:hypothetical protein
MHDKACNPIEPHVTVDKCHRVPDQRLGIKTKAESLPRQACTVGAKSTRLCFATGVTATLVEASGSQMSINTDSVCDGTALKLTAYNCRFTSLLHHSCIHCPRGPTTIVLPSMLTIGGHGDL